MNTKGAGALWDSLFNMIVLAVILLGVLYLVSLFYGGNKSMFNCLDRGGVNVNPDDPKQVSDHPDTDWNCIRGFFTFFLPEDQKNLMCCLPESDKAKLQAAQEQKTQRQTIESGGTTNPGGSPKEKTEKIEIIVTLDEGVVPFKNGQTLTLDAYRKYTLHTQFKGDVSSRYCTFHLIDPNTPNKEEFFNLETAQGKAAKIIPIEDPNLTLLPCSSIDKTEQEFYLPELYTSKLLQLEILVHSEKLLYTSSSIVTLQDRNGDAPSVRLNVNIKTTPAVSVTMQPTTWSTQTEIKLTCNTVLCEDIRFGTVYPSEGQDLSTWNPQEVCDQLKDQTRFTKIVHNLPPGANPAIPNNNPVEVSLKPQKQPNGKPGKIFTVDAETLRTDFGRNPAQTHPHEYPCFQIGFLHGEEPLTKTTEKPLLIDAKVPTLSSELIRINYQTPTGELLSSNGKYDPKLAVSSTFASIPPEACQDSSGCIRYYYSYTPLQDFTPKNDLIGKIMNEVFRTLYAKSLTDANCKPAGAGYKSLQPKAGQAGVIPLNQQGLGYLCLYAQDNAGNNGQPILIPYLNPYSTANQLVS